MGTATTKIHKRVDIRRNDNVKVMTGRDAGKEGRVLRVFPDDAKVLVEHVMTVKKHVRPNPQRNIKGGIVEKEAAIHVSNVAIVCKNCKQHTRLANKVLADGRRVRACRKCGSTIE